MSEQNKAEMQFTEILRESLSEFVGRKIAPELIKQVAVKANTMVKIAPQFIEVEREP